MCVSPSVTPTVTVTTTPTVTPTPSPLLNRYMSTRCCDPGVAVMQSSSEGTFVASDGDCWSTLYEVTDEPTISAISSTTCGACTSTACNPTYTRYVFSVCGGADVIFVDVNDELAPIPNGSGLFWGGKCYYISSIAPPNSPLDTTVDSLINNACINCPG